jgi:Reverse transcriptase (RNA-dependent DNA polymerase)
VHYDEDTKSSLVVNETTIPIILMLMLLASWNRYILDVNRAFLNGHFKPQHKMYLEVAQGFENHYGAGVVLLLLRMLYGTKQAVQFWQALNKAMGNMKYTCSQADLCLFYKRNKKNNLSIWISWVDNLLTTGQPNVIEEVRKNMIKEFDCDDVGELEEFIMCKIATNKTKKCTRLTQPV